jgi:hypothetical protein
VSVPRIAVLDDYQEAALTSADCDIVTVHLRLSDRSRGLVGARELAWLGPRGYLVNTSRGPIVDEAAYLPWPRRRLIIELRGARLVWREDWNV